MAEKVVILEDRWPKAGYRGRLQLRQIEMSRRVLAGETFKVVGESYAVTPSRVQQLFRKTLRVISFFLDDVAMKEVFPRAGYPRAWLDHQRRHKGADGKVTYEQAELFVMSSLPLHQLRQRQAFLICQLDEIQRRLEADKQEQS